MKIMVSIFKKYLRKLLPVYSVLFRNYFILSVLQGQKRSIKEKKPVNSKGTPIPWYTYPSIEFLNQFDFSNSNIFEFGSGNSSIYWAKRCNKVISVENDIEWYNHIKKLSVENQVVYLRENKNGYLNLLKEQKMKFDIIIIDGKWRNDCAKNALDYLHNDGLIIFDNSDWYPKTMQFLRRKGLFQVDFNGFGPVNNYCWTTSIFLKARNSMQNNFSNPNPIGGTKKVANGEI